MARANGWSNTQGNLAFCEPSSGYSAAKLSAPTHNWARDFKLFLYVRDTVYFFAPLTRSKCSPVVQG